MVLSSLANQAIESAKSHILKYGKVDPIIILFDHKGIREIEIIGSTLKKGLRVIAINTIKDILKKNKDIETYQFIGECFINIQIDKKETKRMESIFTFIRTRVGKQYGLAAPFTKQDGYFIFESKVILGENNISPDIYDLFSLIEDYMEIPIIELN